MVPEMGTSPILIAVKEGILKLLDEFAVPPASKPIPGLELVQIKDVAFVPVNTIGEVTVPLQ